MILQYRENQQVKKKMIFEMRCDRMIVEKQEKMCIRDSLITGPGDCEDTGIKLGRDKDFLKRCRSGMAALICADRHADNERETKRAGNTDHIPGSYTHLRNAGTA